MGYFLPESSQIVPVDECPFFPAACQIIPTAQDLTRSNSLPGQIEEIEAFADSSDEKAGVERRISRIYRIARHTLQILFATHCRNSRAFFCSTKKRMLRTFRPRVSDAPSRWINFRVSHLSFFQVNRFLIEGLLQSVVSGKKGTLALDLYAESASSRCRWLKLSNG